MKNIFIVILVSLFLTSCQYSTDSKKDSVDITQQFKLPTSMKDCEIHQLERKTPKGSTKYIYITYCPNATTTTNSD